MAIYTMYGQTQLKPSGWEPLAEGIKDFSTNLKEGAIRRDDLKREHAKLEQEENDKRRDYADDLLDKWSRTIAGMDENDIPAIIESDMYKESMKVVKKVRPEMVIDDKMVLLNTKDLVSKELDGTLPYLKQIMDSGEASEAQQTVWEAFKKWGKETLAGILAKMKGMPQTEVIGKLKSMLERDPGQNRLTSGIAQSDPLGIRS